MNVLGDSNLIIQHRDHFEIAGVAWDADYTRVDTPMKLLSVINLLCEKSYITTAHIRELIRICDNRFGFGV